MTKSTRTILQWGQLTPKPAKAKTANNGMVVGAVVLVLAIIGFYFLRGEISGSNAAIDFIPDQTIFVSETGDDGNLGDVENPVRTLQRALTMADESSFENLRVQILGEQYAISGDGPELIAPVVLDGNKQIILTGFIPDNTNRNSKILVYDPETKNRGGLNIDIRQGALAINNLHFDMDVLELTLHGESFAEIYDNVFTQERKWFNNVRLNVDTQEKSAAAIYQNDFYFMANPQSNIFSGDVALATANSSVGGGQKITRNNFWFTKIAVDDSRLENNTPFIFTGIATDGNYVGIVRNNFKMIESGGGVDSGRYLGIRSAGTNNVIAQNVFRSFTGSHIVAGFLSQAKAQGLGVSGEDAVTGNTK